MSIAGNQTTRFLMSLLVIALCVSPVMAQTKRALVIGIDTYKPEGAVIDPKLGRLVFSNLQGSVNDATAIRDLVISRYGFEPANIKALYNADASREGIINAFKELVAGAGKGDIIFIYYAGHGSQVYNSLSTEADKKDESIVPADGYLGAEDIRDKELSVFFNQLVDKGVTLTVIFDSCHSGSIGRSLINDPPVVRFIPATTRDAKDASNPGRPEQRGALLLSAAQDFEYAREQKDENNISHGAFTIALLKTLSQLPADASVNSIFSSINAILKYYGKEQEPVLAGNAARKSGTLFGLPAGAQKKKLEIGVSKADATGVDLLGGYAFGLSEGVRLAAVGTTDTLEITEMLGVNRSRARLLKGDPKNIKPGTLFEIVNWASSAGPALSIYIPPGADVASMQKYIALYAPAQKNPKVQWITNVDRTVPDKAFYFANGEWILSDAKGNKKLGKLPAATAVNTYMSGKVYVNFPPAERLRKQLEVKFSSFNNIRIVNSPGDAQYTITGRLDKLGKLEYALVKTQVTTQDTAARMPLSSDFVLAGETEDQMDVAATKLVDYAFRLAKIRDWLMLPNPSDGTEFPFGMSFRYYNSTRPVVKGEVKVQDTVSVFFTGNKATITQWNGIPRYIYIFSIDSRGAMSLLYPDAESGNVENRLPAMENDKPVLEAHLTDFKIVPPLGIDNYFMLSSEEAITNLSAFEQEGVISRSETPDEKNKVSALERLLYTGAKSRTIVVLPVNWSLVKSVLRTSK